MKFGELHISQCTRHYNLTKEGMLSLERYNEVSESSHNFVEEQKNKKCLEENRW